MRVVRRRAGMGMSDHITPRWGWLTPKGSDQEMPDWLRRRGHVVGILGNSDSARVLLIAACSMVVGNESRFYTREMFVVCWG